MRDVLRRVAAALTIEPGAALVPPSDTEDRPTVGIAGLIDIPGPEGWPAIAAADAPELTGDWVHFVALPDRTLVVDEDIPDGSLTPLAEEIEAVLEPPYRGVAVRKDATLWAVAAQPVHVVELDADADVVEIALVAGERNVTVDGEPDTTAFPELERLGEERGDDYALRAERVDGQTWVVDVWPI